MARNLDGKRVAIVATDGFEQSELTEPKRALEAAGARTEIISLRDGKIRGWKARDWGDAFDVDTTIDQANPDDYDALVLPGGVMNPDKLRMDNGVVAFVRTFFDDHKPVGAICHGPWTLINADVVKGRHMTSYPSLRQDLVNAGAQWTDSEVVTDRGLVTSRRPDDLPAFNRKLIEEIAEGAHERVGAS
jgi:protease I